MATSRFQFRWWLCLSLLGACTGPAPTGPDDDAGSAQNAGAPDAAVVPALPTVEAGEAQEVDEGEDVDLVGTVTGSASVTLSWTQVRGPEVVLDGATTLSAGFTAPAVTEPTLLVFRLTARTTLGEQVSDETSVLVRPVNALPLVDAGEDQERTEGEPVTLTGTASDPDGTAPTVTWQQLAGPAVTLTGENTLQAAFTAPAVTTRETLVFQLTATDADGASARDTVSVVVTGGNIAPVVVVEPDQTVTEGATVVLGGSATDEDGTIASLQWSQLGGTPVTLEGADTGTATFVAPDVQTAEALVFELVAVDNEGLSAAARLVVLVLPANASPTVEAGADQDVREGTQVTLTGQASDVDGTITGTQWTQLGGPSVTLDSPTTLGTTFTAPAVTTSTTLLFSLSVTDNEGASARDVVTVHVLPVNAAPVVDAGADQTLAEELTVTLAGTASDADGTVASLFWTQLGGPTVTLADPTAAATSFLAPPTTTSTTLIFSLTATDNEGLSASDVVLIHVQPLNDAPSVDAGGDQTVDEGASVQLVGWAGDDSGIASTVWTQVGGPTVTLGSATSLVTSFTAPLVATSTTLIFSLTVTDDEGASASDVILVHVLPVNAPPVVDAGVDRTVNEGVAVQLSGNATDADGTVATTRWTQVGGPEVTLDNPFVLNPSFTSPGSSTTVSIIFVLTATDNEGASTSDSVTVVVNPLYGAPTVDAGADQEVTEGEAVQLTGTASDVDGTIVATQWEQTGGPAVVLSGTTSLTTSFTAPATIAPVTLAFTLTVTDNDGLQRSDLVLVEVSPLNLSPTVDAGVTRDVVEGDTVSLAGSATDPDGTIASVLWTQVDGPIITLDDPTSLSAVFTAPATAQPASVVLLLEVVDNEGARASDLVVIRVAPDNLLPTADAGLDQVAREGEVVTLAGGADDLDGTLASVLWTQTAGPPVTLSDETVLQPSFTAPATSVVVTLVFVLTATDNEGAQGMDTMTVQVSPINASPVVNAGNDQQVDEGDPVYLAGTATDPDGQVASTTWNQVQGPQVTLSDPNALVTQFTAPLVTELTTLAFILTGTDEEGASTTDLVAIRIAPVNSPPAANAGVDQFVQEGDSVLLSGTASDVDGTVASVRWTQVQGPVVVLSDPTLLSTSFTAPAVTSPTVLVFTLTVTDNENSSAANAVSIRVDPLNMLPTVSAGPDQTVTEGDLVQLSGTASDVDGSVFATQWTQLDGPDAQLSDPTSLFPQFVAPETSVLVALVFVLTAYDQEGASTSDVVVIRVQPDNAPPVVSAGGDQVVPEDVVVTLTGTASDPDGTIASHTWSQLQGTPVTLDDPSSLTPTFTTPTTTQELTLIFALAATDDEGTTTTDFTVVRVTAVNAPPTASAGPDQDVLENALVTLSGTASDADGTVVSTQWTQTGGTAVTLSSSTELSPTFTAPPAFTVLTFRLLVTDNEGGTSVDTVVINVYPDPNTNRPPTVAAGLDQVVPSGSVVTLNAAASDVDGTVTNTTWTQVSGPAVTLADPGALQTTFTAPVVACAANLVFRLTAVDDDGADASDTVAITISGQMGSTIPVGTNLDLESNNGGLVTEGTLWAYGIPTTGPTRGHVGTRVWATNLTGNYPDNAQEYLCLPPVDRSGASDVTVTFRLWSRTAGDDGLRLQALDPNTGWTTLTGVTPAYDGTASGALAWSNQGINTDYVLAGVRLPSWTGDLANLRLFFRSNNVFTGDGPMLDELRFDSEGSDPDVDGITGVLDEYETYGTDPYLADTDGDGALDGAEVAADTDPLDPADAPGVTPLLPGTYLDFETNNGGFASTEPLWAHGVVSSGPGVAYSGTRVWATNPAGNYGDNERAYLNLPPLDLRGATNPTLSFRLWMQASGDDGLNVQVYQEGSGWTLINPQTPAYEARDAFFEPAWSNVRYRNEYQLAALSLAAYANQVVRVRLSFRSNGAFVAPGAYVDDLALDDESADPDADGISGVLDEQQTWGTDPYLPDTDGDGTLDGAEIVAGTDPLDPADHPGAVMLLPGTYLDFESDDGGLSTDGPLWEYGVPASGPGYAYSGTRAWATELSGNYYDEAREYLYLPPLDLSAASDPTLSFRLWMQASGDDGLGVEVYDDNIGWTLLNAQSPVYEARDALFRPAWNNVRYLGEYKLAVVSLAAHAGQVTRVRLSFRSNGFFVSLGAYVDDLALEDESTDVDGDGIPGVRVEVLTYGTDPYRADTDGDGALDGAEVAAGTDPLNPAWFPGSPTWAPGNLEDLSVDDGGLATDGTLWEYDAVASGPNRAHTGSRAWATNTNGNYFDEAREYLYLPNVDLAGATDPSLVFRLWSTAVNGDGLSLEIDDPALGWTNVAPSLVAYDGTDTLGFPAWINQRVGATGYKLVGFSLQPWVGATVRLRLAFRSNGAFVSTGAYLDDFLLDEEAVDLDGDGLNGLVDEASTYGTDPQLADTDGDTFTDGVEVAGGFDPLDPLDHP
ncbi:MAG: hypothetical protein AB2A00_14735 [Myxococcota bacterium]